MLAPVQLKVVLRHKLTYSLRASVQNHVLNAKNKLREIYLYMQAILHKYLPSRVHIYIYTNISIRIGTAIPISLHNLAPGHEPSHCGDLSLVPPEERPFIIRENLRSWGMIGMIGIEIHEKLVRNGFLNNKLPG